VMMAFGAKDDHGELKAPAMKKNGIAIAGKMKINSHALRAEGLEDATMTLDGDRWDEWPPLEQESLVHHELNHLEPTGKVDQGGRPKLKNRPHDHECGVFEATMIAYGPEAMDTKIVAEIAEDTREWIQPCLSWG
jgi:Putative phage metallopeptidase